MTFADPDASRLAIKRRHAASLTLPFCRNHPRHI
jgi:hypothetical protein